MKTIWKFDITGAMNSGFWIEIPEGYEILYVAPQGIETFIWVLVDTEAQKVQVEFVIYGTGYLMPENPGRYIGTVLVKGGVFVWHIYEKVEE